MYKYYVVSIGSVDYYTHYDGEHIINARSASEAIKKAKRKHGERYPSGKWSFHHTITAVIECGKDKPTKCELDNLV